MEVALTVAGGEEVQRVPEERIQVRCPGGHGAPLLQLLAGDLEDDPGASPGGGGGCQDEPSSVVAPSAVVHDIASQQLLSLAHEDDKVAGGNGAIKDEFTTQQVVPNVGIPPVVGMTFESEEKAYEMYNTYAGKVGFSVRKSTTKRRKDGSISQKYIVCSNQGHRETESSKDSTRTGCGARVQFSVSKEGVWLVQKVVVDHNHYLASPNKSHKLRSQRCVNEADRMLIGMIREAGMKPAQVYEFMKQFYRGADKVLFTKMDCNNEIGRERRKYLEANDAQTLLEYLRNKQSQDPTFFYAVQIDKENGQIANFFWADGQSIMDYKCFGDVVSFDTTFQTNKFEMPFAPILGTNHHKQTIIFGAALIFNETIASFVWLFETFLTAMSGKHPSTIFTDQDAAIAAAVAYVFPNTRHRLCLWHIYLNAAKHLGHVIHESDNKFLPDFKRCVYEDRSEAYFIEKWDALLTKYNLKDNSWMRNLYDLREKWAAVYRDSFTVDMNSTQRSEGMNNVFKKRFRRKLGLSELLVECEKVSGSLRENELDEDFNSRRKNSVPSIPGLPMLKTAADSYTSRMYLEFEEEFKRQFTLSCELLQTEGTNLTFKVTYMQSDHGAIVVFNTADSTITCSCRKFEAIGILCKHGLRVFSMNGVYSLPSRYVLNRWTKYAKRGFYIEKQGSEEEDLKARAAAISRKATSIALKCSKSGELLDDLEKALDKLELEADTSLSKMQEKSNEVPLIPSECERDTLNSTISFRVPQVVKGPKDT
ncbi:unnamed protein product [Urochloa humidicola]